MPLRSFTSFICSCRQLRDERNILRLPNKKQIFLVQILRLKTNSLKDTNSCPQAISANIWLTLQKGWRESLKCFWSLWTSVAYKQVFRHRDLSWNLWVFKERAQNQYWKPAWRTDYLGYKSNTLELQSAKCTVTRSDGHGWSFCWEDGTGAAILLLSLTNPTAQSWSAPCHVNSVSTEQRRKWALPTLAIFVS